MFESHLEDALSAGTAVKISEFIDLWNFAPANSGIYFILQSGANRGPLDRGQRGDNRGYRPGHERPAAWEKDTRGYLVVRVRLNRPATVYPGALGFALPFARSGAHVSVFYDRVQALAASYGVDLSAVLGATMAHELGHVLLGSCVHAAGGLMQGVWSTAQWKLAAAGLVSFSSEEARLMQSSLRDAGFA